jgi:hypothetical protein
VRRPRARCFNWLLDVQERGKSWQEMNRSNYGQLEKIEDFACLKPPNTEMVVVATAAVLTVSSQQSVKITYLSHYFHFL